MALISIVIPSRNRTAYIRQTLDSCLAQSHRPLEVIVADDGSTDGTPELVEQHEGCRSGIIKLLKLPHRCAGAARNAGLDAAQGEYIHYLDSDDLLKPRALELLLAAAQSQGTMGAIGGWEDFEDATGEVTRAVDVTFAYPEDHLASLLHTRFVTGAVLLPRLPIRWKESLPVNDALDYQLRVFTECSIGYTGEIVCSIRQHRSPDRVTSIHDPREPIRQARFYCRFKEYLRERSALTFLREQELDREVLAHAYSAARRGKLDELLQEPVCLNLAQLPSYNFYRHRRLSGFVRFLGIKRGISTFHRINAVLGRA